MPSSRSLRPRRKVAVLAAVLLPFALLGPLAPTATAQPDQPTAPTAGPSTPTVGQDRTASKAASKAKAKAAAKQLKADRLVVAKAPSGVTRFVLWLESIEARKSLGPVSDSRVKADVAQLDRLAPRAVRELSKTSDAKAQRLLEAIVRSEMAPAFNATHAHFVGDRGFFFYVNLQRQLELMGRAAGSTGTVSFLPSQPKGKRVLTLAQHQREFRVDQDGDGVSDPFDEDIDGTGGKNEADPSDNRFGIPDEFLVRTPFVAGPIITDKSAPVWSSCFHARESIPRFMTITAATKFRTARQCGRLDAQAGIAPGNTVPPTTTGSATVGATLTAEPGTWSGTPAPTFSFRWQYQDATGGWPNITGANSATYVVQPGDSGRLLRVNVTATNSAGSAEQISENVGPIGGAASGPVNISVPDISGTATVGGQLVADPGSWSGSPISYGYQWQRRDNGSWGAISGATASAYTPTTADAGDPLRVVVTANNGSGQGTATSASTAAVTSPAQPPANTTLPAISGATVIGSTLTTTNGTWTGSPDDYDYQWQRSTASGGWSAISGATRASYSATNADNGLLLRVLVKADNDSGSATAMSTEVGPVTNPAGTCPVSNSTDTDKDGVADCTELKGFTLNVSTTGTGSVAQRKVTSDPNNPDTDGDLVADGKEWEGFASDPSTADTDGDGLSDFQEFTLYKSGPANVDSDFDAVVPNSNPRSADPRLLDGSEVNGYVAGGRTFSTSPTLADTDGDSIGDYTEINSGGFNPLIADMPKLEVGVPDNAETDIQIFTEKTDGTASETYKGTTTTTTDTTKTHNVDLTNVKTMNTNSTTLDIGAKGGKAKGLPYGEAHLNIKTTWQTGTVTSHQTGSTTDTVHSAQAQYQAYTKETSTSNVVTKPTGQLSTLINVTNPGKITYTIKNLTVTALRSDSDHPGSVQPIATLTPASSVGDITIAPGQTKGPYQVSSDSVSSDLLIKLLANPDGIIYSIPSPQLVNPVTGLDYAVVGQTVESQTAGITVDDGSGSPTTYLVATNVARDAYGASAGIKVKTALDSIVQLDYKTCTQTDGRQVLCQVGDVATTDEFHFWSLLTSEDLPINTGNFDNLTLNAGSVLRMAYTVDADKDGLFDVQENLYGTDLDNADTDGDGLSDFAETQTGWTVPAIGSTKAYPVYSSPLAADLDGDLSSDGCPNQAAVCDPDGFAPESARKTDPNLPDTNADGILDGAQDAPAVLKFCPGCYRSPDFVLSMGSGSGDGDGEFGTDPHTEYTGPGALGVNATTGQVYVADPVNSRVLRFGSDGKYQTAITGWWPNDAKNYTAINGVAVDRTGNVYVLDIHADPTSPGSVDGHLQKFNANGSRLATTAVLGTAVATDRAGNAYVNVVQNAYGPPSSIQKFGPTLNLVTTYQGAPPLSNLTTSGLGVDQTGRIFVVSPTLPDTKIQRFTPPSTTPVEQVLPHQPGFASLAVDPNGLLYAADATNDQVVKLSPEDFSSYLAIGTSGDGDGKFDLPAGVAVDDECNVYVSDQKNARIEKFSYDTGCS